MVYEPVANSSAPKLANLPAPLTARLNNVVLVPTATHASWQNPVETHARDLEELALPGTHFTSVPEVGDALDAAVAYRNAERVRRGKRFRDTVRENRRHQAKTPIWRRAG
jgi:hypothetical protein